MLNLSLRIIGLKTGIFAASSIEIRIIGGSTLNQLGVASSSTNRLNTVDA